MSKSRVSMRGRMDVNKKYDEISTAKESAIISIILFASLALSYAVASAVNPSWLNIIVTFFSLVILIQSVLISRKLKKLKKILLSGVFGNKYIYVPKPILYYAVFWQVPKYS